MKKINASWLPYAAAFVNSGLFGVAGYHYFNVGVWGALIGVGVGAVVSLSVTIASSRINDIAEKRKGLARLALMGMLCLSPATVVLSLFAPTSIFTAIAWAMDADVAVILTGSISGKSLIANDEPAKSKAEPKKAKVKPAKAEQEPAIATPEPAKASFICDVAGCNAKPFGSQSALNAHQRKHKPIAYSVSLVEPVTKDMTK